MERFSSVLFPIKIIFITFDGYKQIFQNCYENTDHTTHAPACSPVLRCQLNSGSYFSDDLLILTRLKIIFHFFIKLVMNTNIRKYYNELNTQWIRFKLVRMSC